MTTTEHPPPAGSWALVAAAQRGDTEAFAQLYRDYAPGVSRFVGGRLRGDEHLGEDLTSETFLRALRRIDTAHNNRGRDVGAWLTTIARNLVKDHYKSARARYERDGFEELPEPRTEDRFDAAPDQRVLARSDRAAAACTVRATLAAVTPAQRRALELYDLEPGRKLREVAEEMGRSTKAVEDLRRKGLRAMRRQLAEQGFTSSQQCLEAVGRARDAVDQLAQPRHQPAAARPAPSADRWAGQSVAAAVGTEVAL